MDSKHYNQKRYKRQRIIDKYINGDGYIIDGFVIDKGHKDGAEVHSITDTGLILIHNYESGKLVTKIIARPKQIKRYYKGKDKEPPKWLLDLCEWHTSLGYNKV